MRVVVSNGGNSSDGGNAGDEDNIDTDGNEGDEGDGNYGGDDHCGRNCSYCLGDECQVRSTSFASESRSPSQQLLPCGAQLPREHVCKCSCVVRVYVCAYCAHS